MNQEKIGKFIKEIRIKNNLTQKELADKLGVTYQAVSKWENGRNIPDITLLQKMSDMFNVDITDILNGKKRTKKNKKIIIISILFIIIGIILVIFFTNNNFVELKPISTSCKDFTVIGSAAYDNNKTSIIISDVDYCGKEDNTIYKTIEYTLYEEDKNTQIKIDTHEDTNVNNTIEDYIKHVKIKVDRYTYSCKEFKSSNIYLEIKGTTKDDNIIVYTIPIELDENC